MLRVAVSFLVLGFIAILMGLNGYGGISLDAGKMLTFIFLLLAVISFIASLVGPNRRVIHW